MDLSYIHKENWEEFEHAFPTAMAFLRRCAIANELGALQRETRIRGHYGKSLPKAKRERLRELSVLYHNGEPGEQP